jgi:CRP/FNR family transcriptional regulator, cyclic AMP receptor protein
MTISNAPFDLFQWMPDDARAAFLASCRTNRLAKGSLIYSQGDQGSAMFRLISGSVRLSVARSDGRELLYLLFEPGDCFGTSACIDDEPLPQTAEAAEDIDLQILPRAMFDRLRAEHRAFDDALLRLTARHMRFLSQLYADAHLDDLPVRVATRLLSMVKSFGRQTQGGIALSIRISQSELAAMVGGSRQSVNRALQALQAAGVIGIANGHLIVHSLDALAEATASRIKTP